MKLRLPHKFQAALIAAIASVSFTTLSTGTLAVTAGAALLAGQQAQADDNPLDSALATFESYQIQQNLTVDGWTVGDPITIAFRVNTNAVETQLKNSWLKGTADVYTFMAYSGTWNGNTTVYNEGLNFNGSSTNKNAQIYAEAYRPGGNTRNYNISGVTSQGQLNFTTSTDWSSYGDNMAVVMTLTNGNTLSVTWAVVDNNGATTFYSGSTTLQSGSYTTFTPNGDLKNISTNMVNYVAVFDENAPTDAQALATAVLNHVEPLHDLAWDGTESVHNWMGEGAWENGATFESGMNAHFNNTAAYKTVDVTSAVAAGTVEVNAGYTFNIQNGGSLTANALTVESGLAITGAGTVSAATIAAAGKTISLDSGVTLRDVTTGQGTLTGAGTYVASSASNVLAGLDTGTGWTGTIDATVVDGGTNLLDLLTNTHIHGGTVQLKSKGSAVAPGGTETALETSLANAGRTGDFTLADTTFKTGGALRFNDYNHNHVWTVGSGSGLQVGGDLWMDHGNKLAIGGGSVTVGGKLLLGHSGGSNPTGLVMSGAGASLKAATIDAYSNAANKHIPVSITGGTVEFTTTGNALQIHNSAVCDVTLGGSGSDQVILKAGSSSWTFAYDGMTVGNVTAQTEAGKTITLGAAGMSATYTGGLTIQADSNLKLGGTIARATSGSIDVTGALTLANDVVFNLTNFTHTGAEGSGTYTIFSGSSAVDLSGYGFTVANITGFTGAGQATDYGWTFNADGTISYSTAVEFAWAGTQGEWMASNAWTKNGESATYVSSPNSSARFGASTGESFVKDIAVNSAVVAVDMVVNDAYAFTLGNGASIAASAITVDGEGASLTFNGTGTVTTMGISASGKTITVGSGILLQGGTEDAFNLDGSGTYALGAGTTTLGNVVLADSWAGTVRIVDASATNLDFAQYVKGISTLELKGFSGWSKNWYQSAGVNEENIKLTNGRNGYAWEFTGSTQTDTNYVSFTGDWSGDGKLLTKSNRLDYRFSGDISRWNGMFQVGSGNLELVFSGKATAVNAAIDRNGNTLNVEVGNGTNAFSATFGNTVNASKIEIKNGATATFNKAVTLSGDLTMDGTDAAQSHAVFKEGGSVGVIDLSHGGKAHGTVTVSAGKNLTYGSSFWGANNNKLILEEGATVAKAAGAPATIKGLVGGGYVSSTANDVFELNKSCYTLSNVEATINNASDNVQLHFDNSKLATAQNITLKDTTSVFRGMDINGGTTTVGASVAADTAVQLGAVTLSGGNLTLAEHVIGAVNGMNVTASGTVSGGTLKMGSEALITLGENAGLTLSGVTVDLSSKELQGGGTRYDFGQNAGNGFAITEGKVQLVDFATGSTISEGTGVSYKYGSNNGTLVTDEGENQGYVTFGDASYSAFYVNVAGQTESLDYAINTAAGHEIELEAVYLNAGTLNADVTTKVASLHINETADKASGNVSLTGAAANFGTVSGKGTLNVAADTTLTADTLSIAAGETLTFTGSEHISFGIITNHGTLGIGTGTKVATTGDITVSAGDTFTTTGEGTLASTAELKVLGGTATLGSESEWSAIRMGNGSLNINADTTVSGMVELGPENGQMNGNLTVNNGATLTASQVKASWGYSTMAINGIVNATEKFSIATGSSNEVTGTGTINTANLDVSNVTVKATFKGGLTINVGDGGITGGQPLELQDVTIGVLEGSNGWTANRAIILGSADTGTTFNIGNGKEVTLSGAISGSGKLVKDGDGTLNLASNINNTDYTGNIEVKDGTLTVNGTNGNAFHSVSVAEGATVELIGKSNQDYRLRYTLDGGTLTSSGSATGGGNVQNDQISLTKNSTISGSANFYMLGGSYNETSLNLGGFTLTKEGTNTVNLINTDVSTGSIAVKEGTLNFVHRNDKPDSRVEADIELNGGTITGAYKYTNSETAVSRTLTAKQDVTASAAIEIGTNVTLATSVDNGKTLTMTGALTGNGGLAKTGDGTLALTAAASYNGATAVDQGTLALGSSITTSGDVTVAAGAAITFANGATISANTLGLEAGATLDFSDYQGAIGSEIHVVTTTNGVTGYGDAVITGPTAPRGMQASVEQKDKDIVLTFQAKSDATMHLYILTGQSNSLGAVKDSPLNATMLAAYQSEGLLWNGNMHKDRPSGANTNRYIQDPDWQVVAPQEPGLTLDAAAYKNNPCMGPEYGFSYIMENNDWAAQLLEADDTLAVVKGSLDGGGNGYWLQDNNAYKTLLDNVKLSIQDAVALGYSNISLDGLMYLQGESNSANEASQAATRFTDFIGYLKSDLQSWLTENPELTGITLSFDGNTVTGEPRLGSDARQTTETQLLELATSNDMINADKNGKGHVLTNDLAVTNCDGLNVHYTGNAQLTIGARYAYAFAVQKGIDVGAVRGQDDSKTLNQAGAWWMEKLPGENEVATWDISSVSTVNDIADGATLTVGGIKIDEVYSATATAQGQGSIAINGGAISLGADGINLVGGDLAITSAVSARATQTWQAAEGHKLAVNGTTTIGDAATLTLADGLHLTFGAITGTGNLEIGTVTFDMDLDYMLANGLGKYRTSTEEVAENGFFTDKLDLVKLTGETSAITFKHEGGVENIIKAGDLANYNLQLSDDSKALQLMGLAPDEDTYFTRKGEVTYTNTDAGEYGIYTAKQVMLSGSVDQPATLKLASTLKEGVTIVASGLGGTVDIVDGVTLAATSVNAAGGTVVLAGKGTFALGGTVALPTNVMLGDQDKWTGTVRIANVSGTAAYDIKLNDLGNESSIVEFEGVTGYLNTVSYTYTPNIKLTGEGLNIDAGATDGTYYFNGDVTGSGKLNLSLSRGSNNHTLVFKGDVKGWNGEILAPTNGKTLTVKFSDEADTVNAAITRTGGTLNLYALTATTFNGAITGLSSFVVDDSKSASVLGGIGTAATTLNSGASLTIGGTANSSLGTVTLNNNTALTIAGTGAVTAGNVKVADQCASTITLGNDLAMSQLDTIGANHTLSIGSAEGVTKTLTTGKLGFDNVGTVISLQNAHMVVTGAATAGVLDAHSNNRGTMTVGENATLDLQGTTQWNTNDSKYVDLVVKDGGSVSVSGGADNKIRNVSLGENGTNASLSFGAETHTAIANTNVAASAHATVNGGNAVDFGNVNVAENAELSVMNLGSAASVSVSDVTIGAGATMGVYTGSDVSSLDEAALVIASGKTLTADNGATLNANLVMDKDSVLDVSGTGGAGLLMGSSVTLNPGVTLSGDDMEAITALGFMDQYTLFTGVDAFSYDGTISFDSKTWVKASEVFSNDQFKTGEKDYYVFYSGAQNGSNVGAVYVMQLPEPTTGTLSLLALAALAARRRRK